MALIIFLCGGCAALSLIPGSPANVVALGIGRALLGAGVGAEAQVQAEQRATAEPPPQSVPAVLPSQPVNPVIQQAHVMPEAAAPAAQEPAQVSTPDTVATSLFGMYSDIRVVILVIGLSLTFVILWSIQRAPKPTVDVPARRRSTVSRMNSEQREMYYDWYDDLDNPRPHTRLGARSRGQRTTSRKRSAPSRSAIGGRQER
jgi:hypothetical protein